jgi:hypothetical protein
LNKTWKYKQRTQPNQIPIILLVIIMTFIFILFPTILDNFTILSIIPILIIGVTTLLLLRLTINELKVNNDFIIITDNLIMLCITPIFGIGVAPVKLSILFEDIKHIDLLQFEYLTLTNFKFKKVFNNGIYILLKNGKAHRLVSRFENKDFFEIIAHLKLRTTITDKLSKFLGLDIENLKSLGKEFISLAREFSKHKNNKGE